MPVVAGSCKKKTTCQTWAYLRGFRSPVLVTASVAVVEAAIVATALPGVSGVQTGPLPIYDPVSRSACVIVWEPVHTIVAPGAKVATGIDGVQLKPASAEIGRASCRERV